MSFRSISQLTPKAKITASIMVLISLLLGGFIYILFRPTTLLMFVWFEEISLELAVISLRTFTQTLPWEFPAWVILSLPHALWTFSLTITIAILWDTDVANISKTAWLLTPLVVSLTLEIIQLFGVIGYFDLIDIISIIIGYVVGLYIVKSLGGLYGGKRTQRNKCNYSGAISSTGLGK